MTAQNGVVGFIGDSITYSVPPGGTVSPAAAACTLLSTSTRSITACDQGQDGASTALWLPTVTGGYYQTAQTAFLAAGVRVTHIMLGANDAGSTENIPAPQYQANLASICAALVASGFLVVLSYPPAWVVGSYSNRTAAGLALLQSYLPQIDSLIDGKTILQGDTQAFAFFSANGSELWDGVHPGPQGVTDLAGLWSSGLSTAWLLEAPVALPPSGATDGALGAGGFGPFGGGDVILNGPARQTADNTALASTTIADYPNVAPLTFTTSAGSALRPELNMAGQTHTNSIIFSLNLDGTDYELGAVYPGTVTPAMYLTDVITGLPAGQHTATLRYAVESGGTWYCRPVLNPHDEYLRLLVSEYPAD